MTVKLKNNVASTLRTEILSTDTTINLPVGHGARFPALAAGEYFYATIEDTSGQHEIVQATARSGDVLTVVRGAESTTPRAFVVGSRIEMRITAASVLDAAQDAAAGGGGGGVEDLTDLGVTATAEELNILDGVTATTAELNILDGVTATTAELNILDGVTATAEEINLLDGALSGTVVNGKAVVYGGGGEVAANTIRVGDGTDLSPSISFANDTDTGLYRVTDNRIGIAVGGEGLIASFEPGSVGVFNMGNHAARTEIRVDTNTSQTPRIQVEGTSRHTAVSIVRNGSGANSPPYLVLGRTRGSADGNHDIVLAGDTIGVINFVAADGEALIRGASIVAQVELAPDLSSMPTRLSFRTTGEFSVTPTERFAIGSTGAWSVGSGEDYGLPGQVLTSNGPDSEPSWGSASNLILLGTLNTASGTTHTLSDLDLTFCNFLRVVVDGVTSSAPGGSFTWTISVGGAVFYSKAVAVSNPISGLRGVGMLEIASGVGEYLSAEVGTEPGATLDTPRVVRTALRDTSTSISITISGTGAAFAGGTVRIYGFYGV